MAVVSGAAGEAHQRCLEDAMDDYKHDCLVTRLVNTMAEAVCRSGGPDHERRKRALKDTVCTDRASRKVAEARFALAADDGAYMRMNVVPLQTVGADEDQKLTARLTPAMESAGYAGMLDTLDKKVDSGIVAEHARLNQEWRWVLWLVSIEEVCDYVKQAITALRSKDAIEADVASLATELVDTLEPELKRDQDAEAACVIVRVTAALFGKPRTCTAEKLSHSFERLERAQAQMSLAVRAASQLRPAFESFRTLPVLAGIPGRDAERLDVLPEEALTHDAICEDRDGNGIDANTLNGLIAAIKQMAGKEARGPGGEPETRQASMPAFWTGRPSDWRPVVFPGDQAAAAFESPADVIDRLRAEQPSIVTGMRPMLSESGRMLSFCLARGLCANKAPHHMVDDERLPYSIPKRRGPAPRAPADCRGGIDRASQDRVVADLFGGEMVDPSGDFCDVHGEDYEQVQKVARWVPFDSASSTDLPEARAELAVAEAAVLEHLARHCIIGADSTANEDEKLLHVACAAFAKVKQLRSMALVFQVSASSPLAPSTRAGSNVQFCTRPVHACDGDLAYPFDAGLAAYSISDSGSGDDPSEEVALLPKQAEGLIFTPEVGFGVVPIEQQVIGDRVVWSKALQLHLHGLTDRVSSPLLYIADPPVPEQFQDGTFPEVRRRSVDTAMLPPDSADLLQIEAALCRALDACEAIERLHEEKRAIEAHRKRIETDAPRNPLEDSARDRRHAIWNDSMREMAISGDRLYAFVRQLAGTINENVDAVCFVDDSMLVQQQNKRREVSERLAADAAKQHMQLVSQVFKSVISGSGLRLGIEDGGKGGDFTVVASELRKQVADLASGQGSEGFFSSSVRLENLLAHGTGEMTLTSLFERIKDVGVALQNAALSSSNDPGKGYDAPSLEFLSAPRNSLILRYKPEAHAAIRQAYEIFQREMRAHTSSMLYHRRITAFELIEGRSDELSMAFAAFCAHVLAGQRMFSASQAAYLGAFASKANLAAMQFALQKLVSAACRYLAYTPERPRFLDPNGRDQYFTNFY